jgi:hypothetical protein
MIERATTTTTRQPAILKSTISRDNRFENTVKRFKDVKGYHVVADYLSTKGRKSKRTSVTFAYGLEHFDRNRKI